MKRFDLINSLIKKNNYKNYLEIGAATNINFNKIECEYKVGVDPGKKSKNVTYNMTSDEFFTKNVDKFDIIFIDGLHIKDQVIKDINNSLECLNTNGMIVLHDCNPKKEEHQRQYRVVSIWNGDCWKAILFFRMNYTNFNIATVNTDQGCCIMQSGNQDLYPKEDNCETWDYFNKNRKQILNLIDVKTFKSIYL